MMFSQDPTSKNMSTTNFKNGNVGEEQLQNPNGLARYRSAPSSFFASFLDGLNMNSTNSDSSQDDDNDADNMFSSFMGMQDLNDLQGYSLNLKQEVPEFDQLQNGVSNVDSSQMCYESCFNETGSGNGYFGGKNDENQLETGRISCGNASNNLLRQSSSPAGFFAGFDISRKVDNFKSIGESNSTSNCGNNQLNFTSRQSTAPRFMPSIAENGNESLATRSSKDGQLKSGANSIGRSYISGSWNESSSGSLKRNQDGDLKFSSFDSLENDKADSRNVAHGLTHHLSLTKTSSEMAGIEKYLDFQQDNNVVACKLRAKRGFATHPRSIAERVRRTRISERMKKLQELFPNMDKQTNTADMLDLAVEHIKELQKQVQTLTDIKAKCKCPR